jgi:dipeptidyl aminopeptidase/acylaminoacyl peptidase
MAAYLTLPPGVDKAAGLPAIVMPHGGLVPAYLTLPPGVERAQGLSAILMPHGGPASRDVWGFDWLAQYYANRGFAVLQPNFRGSAGYGSEWFAKNGFRSWKVAIGDIIEGGRWLVSQGVADSHKLAIVGWAYGGYAALQANVVDPDLFKAVVAIAPVTDLNMLKNESEGFTNERMTRAYVGAGPYINEGSPAQHTDQFKAPVMLFHGGRDANVDVAESQAMYEAMKRSGKQSELVVYPNLDHQLLDNTAREDMLQRSYDFLMTALK